KAGGGRSLGVAILRRRLQRRPAPRARSQEWRGRDPPQEGGARPVRRPLRRHGTAVWAPAPVVVLRRRGEEDQVRRGLRDLRIRPDAGQGRDTEAVSDAGAGRGERVSSAWTRTC